MVQTTGRTWVDGLRITRGRGQWQVNSSLLLNLCFCLERKWCFLSFSFSGSIPRMVAAEEFAILYSEAALDIESTFALVFKPS